MYTNTLALGTWLNVYCLLFNVSPCMILLAGVSYLQGFFFDGFCGRLGRGWLNGRLGSSLWVRGVADGRRTVLSCFVHKRQVGSPLGLYSDRHTYVGKGFFEVDDVLVAQSDAPFAGTAWHTVFVVRTAVNTDARMPWRFKAQEPSTIGFDATASVAKIVTPRAGILYLLYLERLAFGRLGRTVVALTLLLPFVAT